MTVERYLIDTHIVLWALYDPEKLSERAIHILSDQASEKHVSFASIWEVAVKHQAHPSKMPVEPRELVADCQQAGFKLDPIPLEAVFATDDLPYGAEATFGHEDPWDRLLISQAKVSGMAFVTHDKDLAGYGSRLATVV